MPQALAQDIDFHGLPAIRLRAGDGAEAIVLRHGAHLVSWKPANGEERLYLSEKAVFADGKAIRGGVPVIFPQFEKHGPLPRHGFARDRAWQKSDARAGEDYAMAVLRLTDSEETRAIWPHFFVAELTVSVSGERLDIELEVSNSGETAFSFTAALHTYLRVREVEEARLEGLHGQSYRNSLSGQDCTETAPVLMVDDEIDRIYHDTTHPLLLRDSGRSLGIHSENMPDTVVWNPWETKCGQLADMPPGGFRRMLCIEAAVIKEPVRLLPGEDWWGRQTLVAI